MAATKLTINLYTPSSFGDEKSKRSSIIGQNVTSKHKKTTWLAADGFVYKGPFKKGALALSLVTWRSAWFSIWSDVAYVPQTVVHNADLDVFFIRSPNLGILPSDKDTVEKDGYHPGDKSLSGKVLLRDDKRTKLLCEEGGTSRAIDVLRSKGSLPPDTWKAILYHFILRFICRSADTGLWNVLIGPDHRPYGIDFEEVRVREKAEPTTLWDLIFLRKPARVYWRTIEAVMCEAKPTFATLLKEKVIPHLERIGTKVNYETGARTEHEFLARARLALSLCV